MHDDEVTILRIYDDGLGISKTKRGGPGLGLSLMTYRANLAGGELVIDEPPEGGTAVVCVIRKVEEEEFHERAA